VDKSDKEKNQEALDRLVAHLRAEPTKEANGETNGGTAAPPYIESAASATTGPTDDEVLEKCRAAKNAPKFSDLYDAGDVHRHHGGDDSAADQALMNMLAFWTQDEAQLERLFSASALGQREKWRRRANYRKPTIEKALAFVADERYDWSRNGSGTAARPIKRSAASAASGGGEDSPALSLVRFTGRKPPGAREFIIPDLIPRHHPTTLYGWGGTAKSLIAILLGMSVAGRREKFFGYDVAVHGPVLFLDFELDADEQHRRVMQLAAGMEMDVPDDLLYVSTLGVRTHEAIEFALSVCEEHKAVLAVLDSLGPAMVGDMAAARDVIEFHNHFIAPFREVGTTPLLVDHQARQQTGEGYQSKGAFGSAYKEHLSRSLIQVEAGDRSAEQGILNVRLRHKKTNFGTLCDPFDVVLSFSDEKITATVRDLTPADRAQETTLNSKDRVLAALEDGPAYPDELAETTGLTRGTIKNAITTLKKAGRVEVTGEMQGQMEQVQLVAPAARPIKGSATSAASTPTPEQRVAEMLRNPPGWLGKQLEKLRNDPDRYMRATAAAIADEVYGTTEDADKVRQNLEAYVAEPDLDQA
jgi:hypothetical protein